MELSEKLRVNTPNVVHETIDGEAILLDLNTGNYFSLDGVGAVVWDFIDKHGNWMKALEIMKSANAGQEESVTEIVTNFVEQLCAEKLLVPLDGESRDDISPEIALQLAAVAPNFASLRVNKYSDMQDLLLLDPIHEVDEKGWPESRDIIEAESPEKE